MADTVTSTQSFTVVAEFDDGDNRSVSIDNPRENITWADVETLKQYAANVLIGDKNGAKFSRFSSARITNRYTLTLDPESL
ncbi:MAG: hypothetical protein Q4D17_02125 [Planctomycetia bacterium]|nr:hypothetical protein [Planctomycetia bacterium]